MTKGIPAMTARKNFGELLESVFYRGDEVIVERADKPMSVLIPMNQYQKLERQRADALATMERLWASAPVVEDIVATEQEILAETEAARRQRSRMKEAFAPPPAFAMKEEKAQRSSASCGSWLSF